VRCKNAQDILISGGADVRVTEHLQVCPVCQGFARDYENLQEGWHALTARPAPEPSWGFAQRVLRRLEELPAGADAEENFFERVGRRVVYAASFLALILLIALALPSSGPLRSPMPTELIVAQTDRLNAQVPVFAEDAADSPEANPTPIDPNEGTNSR
jgi:hypothetical protein